MLEGEIIRNERKTKEEMDLRRETGFKENKDKKERLGTAKRRKL